MRQREVSRAARWAATVLGVEDWEFLISVRDEPPEGSRRPKNVCGYASNGTKKRAFIWISPARSEAAGFDPLQVLFHEIGHIALHKGGLKMCRQRLPAETLLNHLEPLLLAAYKAGWRIPRARSQRTQGTVRGGRR